jgi:hypothetical protein
MGHYLRRLLDRAEGRLPMLQPRARSLFEPAAAAAASVEEVTAEAAAERPAAMPQAAPQRGRERLQPTSPALAAAPAPTRSTAAALVAATVSGHVNTVAAPQPLAVAALRQPPTPPSLPAAQREVLVMQPVHTQTIVRRAEGSTPPPAQQPEPQPAAAAPAGPPSLPRPAAAASAVLQVPSARAPATAAAALRLAQARQPAWQRSGARAPTAAPVQVSIGRVELRAAGQPPEPARAGAPAAPMLSLDAYLRGRHGGRR